MFIGLLRREMEWFDMVRDGIGSLFGRWTVQRKSRLAPRACDVKAHSVRPIRDLQLGTSEPLGFAIDDVAATLGSIGMLYTSPGSLPWSCAA